MRGCLLMGEKRKSVPTGGAAQSRSADIKPPWVMRVVSGAELLNEKACMAKTTMARMRF